MNFGITAGWRTAVTCVAIFGLLGCEANSNAPVRRKADRAVTSQQDHLKVALQALDQFHGSDSAETQRQLIYQLNRWIETEPKDDAWRPDPQIERLPRRFRDLEEMQQLDKVTFHPDDGQFLVESHWLHAVSRWVSDEASRRWVEARREAEGNDALLLESAFESPEYRLEIARSLFDWTVRHVQLDELLSYPQTPTATVGPGSESAADRAAPPELAIPGPGYLYYPYQVLVYGHGDAWQRARVFILLARQLGYDAVMLAVDDRGAGSRANIWCTGVLIEDRVYLFDAALGLPLPGAEAGSVATLAEVLANPELLRQLDVEDDGKTLKYPITANQLKNVAALVDAAPETLSRRMAMLESRLSGEKAMTLAVSPSNVAARIRACPGLEKVGVRLWNVPFETRIYRDAMERLARRDPDIQRRLLQEQGLYLPAIMQARRHHFVGKIAGEQEDPGAIAYYLESRKADQYIDELQTSVEARARVGLPPLPPNLTPQQQQFVIANQAAQFRLNKQHASYWLGLAQYDLGAYGAAIPWLKDRTLGANPQGIWTAGARYNLGRTYEALGNVEEARKLYFQSESPQRHGDLLRARLLRATPS
jgi:tetratricopeptide (TPR) repeat protein